MRVTPTCSSHFTTMTCGIPRNELHEIFKNSEFYSRIKRDLCNIVDIKYCYFYIPCRLSWVFDAGTEHIRYCCFVCTILVCLYLFVS